MVLNTNADSGSVSLIARSVSAPLSVRLPRAVLRGTGKIFDDEIQNQIGADVVQPGGAQHRKHAPFLADRVAQAVDECAPPAASLRRKILPSEHRCPRRPSPPAPRARPSPPPPGPRECRLLCPCRRHRRVGVRLHAHQIDHALEIALGADRQMDRAWRCVRRASCTLSSARSKLERSRSSLLITMARGSLNSSAKLPNLLRLHLDAGDAVHQHQRRIGRHQRRLACR